MSGVWGRLRLGFRLNFEFVSGFRNIDISRKSGGLCHKFNVKMGGREG